MKVVGTSPLGMVMAEAGKVSMGFATAEGMIEQLGKTFDELDSQRHLSSYDSELEEIKDHFLNLERSLVENFGELEKKEKQFEEKQSENRVLLAEREAAVVAIECALLNRLQDLKDSAVSAIAEAHKSCKVEFLEPVDIGGRTDNKVSAITDDDPNPTISTSGKSLPDNRSGVNNATAIENKTRPEMKELCEKMDGKGLLKFISENEKSHVSLRRELSVALRSASEPARLVLDSLEGFYPPDQPDQPTSQGSEKDAALQVMRRNCLVLIESVGHLMETTQAGSDSLVNSEIKKQAKEIADEWKPKLASVDLEASNGNSSEAQAFLQLLATYGIASDFDKDELCKFVIGVSRRKQAPELCLSLGLSGKVPGIIEALVNYERQLDAVRFAYTFRLTRDFPTVPLLKAFLNGQGKSSVATSGDADASGQDASSQELGALRAVIRCIEDCKLQEVYALGPLQKRVAQLKKGKVFRGTPEAPKYQAKKPRLNATYVPHGPAVAVSGRQHRNVVFEERGLHGGAPEKFPHSAPPAYEVPGYGSYSQHANAQWGYNYPDERIRPPASHAAPYDGSYMAMNQTPAVNHANSMTAGYQIAPTGVNHGNYSASVYHSAPSNYPSYKGAGLQSSYQPYM